MKKTRVNIAEKYPQYFAVTELADSFAELTDGDISRLDKLEAALTPAESETQAAAPVVPLVPATPSAPSAPVAAAPEAPAATPAAPAVDPNYAALLLKIENLERKLDNTPGAQATAIIPGGDSEGKSREQAKTYATSVDAELESFHK